VSAAPFADRRAAGRALGRALSDLRLAPPVVVLALPRGGVPVAAEVARALRAPLELLLVRKIGAPWQPELAVAAVVEGDPPAVVVDETVRVCPDVVRFLGGTP
jgi:putative phosphoribosyl transferase